MDTRIGTCGLCGGNVIGHSGAWFGVVPPPPPKCDNCGALPKWADDTIDMSPKIPFRRRNGKSIWPIHSVVSNTIRLNY